MAGSGGRSSQLPPFFLSYAHARWEDPTDQQNADYWIHRFHHHLCVELEKYVDLPPGTAAPVFIDRRLQIGDSWPDELAEHLTHCAVFVPLYTRRYFRRPDCGREWSVIRQRQDMHVSATSRCPNIVVPVLWEPVQPEDMPPWVRSIQYQSDELSDAYRRRGLESLTRLKDYHDDYVLAVQHIARRIAEVSSAPEQLRPLYEVPKFRQLPDAFAVEGNPMAGNSSVRITVAALTRLSSMPDGRSSTWYGGSATDWCPYRDDAVERDTPAAWRASDVAQRREFDTHVSVLNARSEEVRVGVIPSAPTVLLVDPWATLDENWQPLLRKLDVALKNKPWVRIVLPWNLDDAETVANSVLLQSGIEKTFSRSLAIGRIPSRRGEPGPTNSAAFGPAVSEAIRVAQSEFAKSSDKFLPEGPYPRKPRLRGPAGRAASHEPDGQAGEDTDELT